MYLQFNNKKKKKKKKTIIILLMTIVNTICYKYTLSFKSISIVNVLPNKVNNRADFGIISDAFFDIIYASAGLFK